MDVRSNGSFCIDWVLAQPRHSTVLDFGCGAGSTVDALREHGVDAYGCDVFYGGADRSGQVPARLLERGYVRRMSPNAIPFESERFDLVINDTVLEHVEDLSSTLAEIARVLKPGGKLLSLFPHHEVWFEWHVGLPFIHWIAPGSRARRRYAAAMRALGFGFHKNGKSIGAWSRDAANYLDRWTHYRGRSVIEREFQRHFNGAAGLEVAWLEHKFAASPPVTRAPAWLKRGAVSTLGGLVFECEKPANERTPRSPTVKQA